ncbi:MAG: hypothetical protein LBQ15_02800 [Clostridium sp.]|jgi:hypothetical protein|nr:hypothetical protein [Clostridium sp.]
MKRRYRVNITETVARHVFVYADDPQDACDVAEKAHSSPFEVLEAEFDAEPAPRHRRQMVAGR